MAESAEVISHRAGFVACPGLEGGDELVLVYDRVLKGQQSKQEVAVGGGGSHAADLPNIERESFKLGSRRRVPSAGERLA
jgi:hypothetical protein